MLDTPDGRLRLALAFATTLACAADGRAQFLPPGDLVQHGARPEAVAAVRALLQQKVAAQELAGVSLLVVHDGQVVLRESLGSLTNEAVVRVDSSLVPVLGSAILLASDRGFLRIEDQIAQYLPEFVDGPLGKTTIGELLTRRGFDAPADTDREPRRGRERIGRRREPRAPGGESTPPRAPTPARAPHDPIELVARVLEAATAVPWADWVRNNLFACAGMTTARFEVDATPGGRGRRIALLASLDDLACFGQMHLGKGMCGATRVLSALAIATQHGDDSGVGRHALRGAFGFRRERSDGAGAARTLVEVGLGQTATWIDFDRRMVAVVFVDPGRRRGEPVLGELRARLRALFPAADTNSARTFEDPGAALVTVDSFEILAESGTVAIRLDVTAPRTDQRAPVLLALWSDPESDGDAELEAHWASHGYVVIRFGIPRSIDRRRVARNTHTAGVPLTESPSVDRVRFNARFGDLRTFDVVDHFAARARHVAAVLDQMGRLEYRIPGATAGLDLDRVAVLGVGEGAVTALALGGVMLQSDGRHVVALDPRIRCVIAIDPPGAAECASTPGGLARLDVPALFVVHDATRRPGLATVIQREAFDFVPPGQKYLFAFPRIGPSRASGDLPFPLEPGAADLGDRAEQAAEARRVLMSTTTAFLQACLRGDEESQVWLDAGGLTPATKVAYERK